MPKRSPAEIKAEADSVNALIVEGRKKPLNFALVLGDEGVVLEASATKGEDAMFRAAKANGGSAKGTTGVMNVAGKVIELTCASDDFPASLPRVAKRHFGSLGIKVRIVMTLPDGKVLDDGGEEDEGDGEGDDAAPLVGGDGAGDPPGDDPLPDDDAPVEGPIDRKTDLVNRLRACVQPVTDFNITNKDIGGRLITGLKAVREALGRDDLDAADKLLSAIERTIGTGGDGAVPYAPTPKAPPPPPPQPTPQDIEQERERLRRAFAALGDPLKLFLKRAEPSLAGKARQLGQLFTQEITGSDMKRVAQIVGTLKNFLDAHTPNLPLLTEAERARDPAPPGPGKGPEARYTLATGLQGKYAKGASAARDAFDGFAQILGDQPVTPALLQTAREQIDTVRAELAAPQKRLEQAQAMPEGPQKVAALDAAQKDIAAVQARIDAAVAFEKAARGKDALTKALTVGPLSAKSGQKLPDETAAALIAAFARDPEFATSAIDLATGTTHPEVLAQGIPQLLDLKETGFAAKGQVMDPATADKYAKDLLKMGGNVGADFFDRMPGYMAKGRQFDTDPLNEGTRFDPPTTGTETSEQRRERLAAKTQHRSVALAERLVGDDGTIKPGSKRLKGRVDHMLFNPKSLAEPLPSVNEYALKTIKMFEDPDIAKKANKILGDLPDTAKPSSATLVNRALGKGPTDPVSKRDMQTSVMASMLKSLDQGPVGSCFSTAPARRVRETDPMTAMDAFAQISSKGTYKPPHGIKMPVVTSIHPGEDPILRSWEYTLASSAAKEKKSIQRVRLDNLLDVPMDDLGNFLGDRLKRKADDVGGITGLATKVGVVLKQGSRMKELKKLMSDSFDFIYDPVGSSGPSTDGSSTDGRYILTNKTTGREVRDEAAFVDEMHAIALQVFDIDPTSQDATDIRNAIAAPGFIDRFKTKKMVKGVEQFDWAPWKLRPGGFDEPVTQALHGESVKERTLLDEGTGTDTEGTRTTAVVSQILEKFLDMPDGMVPLSTSGQHAFNGMPEDPSLAPLLKGGKDKIAENLQRELIDKGNAIATTALELERTQALYDDLIAGVALSNDDPANRSLLTNAAATNRPTAPMTPAQIEAAVLLAADAYVTAEGNRRTNPAGHVTWRKDRIKSAATGKLVKECGGPQFVIADTNWGGPEDHTFFVISPDPKTGEPIMWKKTVPPGDMRPAGRDWVDREWGFVK